MTARIWIGNIEPGTTDDEIKAFVKKYAAALECDSIERVEGSGDRPAAILHFCSGPVNDVGNLALRLNGMYWKGRSLSCNTLMH